MHSAVIQGEVRGASVVMGKRRSLLVKVQDHTGLVNLRFYHFSTTQKNQFKAGAMLRCYGEPRAGSSGLEFYHPEYSLIEDGLDAPLEPTLTPIYPATEGITQ